jgi:cell division septal protein FtsQ
MVAKLDLRKVQIASRTRRVTIGVVPPSKQRANKPLSLRARRRRVQAFMALGVGVFMSALVYGASYVSYLPQFNVQDVHVTGTNELPARLVESYIDTLFHDGENRLFSNTTVLSYSPARIAEKTSEYFLKTKNVSISRESLLATAITVLVEERVPYATWCGSVGDCYVLDETGFLFAAASTTAPLAESYIFYGGIQGNPLGQEYIPARFPGAVALLRYLGQAGLRPKEFKISGDKDFSIGFAEGFQAYASFGQDPADLTANLKLVLASKPLIEKRDELSYVDLRFGDRVYYKFKGEEQTGTTTPIR